MCTSSLDGTRILNYELGHGLYVSNIDFSFFRTHQLRYTSKEVSAEELSVIADTCAHQDPPPLAPDLEGFTAGTMPAVLRTPGQE